jgi:endonuclease/exonuclease/phosphatase family metal-dependent hydrolase
MIKKIFVSILLFLSLLISGLYLWGSSGTFPVSDYNQTIIYTQKDSNVHSDTFSLLTYNLGYLSGMTNNLPMDRSERLFEDNMNRVNSVLATLAPDVVTFQEIDFSSDRSYSVNQLKQIAEANNYGYGGMAVNWDKRYVPFPYWPPANHFGKILSGQAILSHFEITSNDRIVLERPTGQPFYYGAFYIDRLAQIVTVEMAGKKVKIINVHLEAFDPATRRNQAQVVLAIYRDLAVEFPVILAGDFNSQPPFATAPSADDESIGVFFREPGLAGAVTEEIYRPAEPEFFTFHSRQPYQMIDFVFYSAKDIEPLAVSVVREFGEASDHLPVLFEFKLR